MEIVGYRRIKTSDIEKLKEITDRSFSELSTDPEDSIWLLPLQDSAANFSGNPQFKQLSWMLEISYQDAGFVLCDQQFPESVYIQNFCVLPEFRGKGYGKRLLEFLFKRLRETDCTRILMILGTHPFFVPAMSLLTAAGFEIVDSAPKGRFETNLLQLNLY